MTFLIDDQVLAAHLRGQSVLPAGNRRVFTTGYWSVRLCRAVSRLVGGRLSGPFAALPQPQRDAAISAVLDLPPDIGLLSLRQLGPRIGELAVRHQPMNILIREALAAAVGLEATVILAEGNENATLLAGLEIEQLTATIVPTHSSPPLREDDDPGATNRRRRAQRTTERVAAVFIQFERGFALLPTDALEAPRRDLDRHLASGRRRRNAGRALRAASGSGCRPMSWPGGDGGDGLFD